METTVKKEMSADKMPPRISLGQCTPQKIRDKEMHRANTVKIIAKGVLYNNNVNDNAKKKEAWLDGKAGEMGFGINTMLGTRSMGRFLL